MSTGTIAGTGTSSTPAAGTFASVPARLPVLAQSAAGRPALVAADGQLTYSELDAQADRWARALRASGAGQGSCVAVLLARGARYTFWAAMGILYGDTAVTQLRIVDRWFKSHLPLVVGLSAVVLMAALTAYCRRRRARASASGDSGIMPPGHA